MSDLRPIVTYPRDAVVDTSHVAAALHVSEEVVGKMDLPCFYAGKKPRYLWGQLLDVFAERANPDAAKALKKAS